MLHYTEFTEYEYTTIKNNKKELVCDDIFCFDCEASSGFMYNGKLIKYTDSMYDKLREFGTKRAWMYIWMLGVNGTVYYGRTMEELQQFLITLNKAIPERKYCYIHNLSYDSQWLLNIINIDNCEVFARKPRAPMKLYVPEYNIEFRCSYLLTNLSLDKCAKRYQCKHEKLKGNLDYSKLIFPTDELDDLEKAYCENDILVMFDFLEYFKTTYGSVHNIPLTQTGEVRRALAKVFKNNISYIRRTQAIYPSTVAEFKALDASYVGGYTHANARYVNKIIKGGKSKDISSSYPTSALDKLPMGSFIKTRKRNFDFENKAYLIRVKWYDIESRLMNTYIPYHQTIEDSNVVLDNGRVAKADMISIMVTSIDYQIIKRCYDISKEEIEEVWVCNKMGYLHKDFIKFILDLYSTKTKLKGLEDEYNLAIYMKNKQLLNSLYGCCVTRITGAEIFLEDTEDVWRAGEVTDEYIQSKLTKQKKSWKCFTNFAWGVWIANLSRANLWYIVERIDEDILYMDTDSCKYLGEHEDVFDEYNKMRLDKLRECCRVNGLDEELIQPEDLEGKKHPLGVYEDDADYRNGFITLGAKKYAYIDTKDEIHITVSGVNKKGAAALHSLDEFREGFVFNTEHCGKQLLTYLDDQESFILPDGTLINQKYGVHMMPTTYELSLTKTFRDYIESIQGFDYYIQEDEYNDIPFT